MKVKVSVILPSLNVADYIEECLDSVVNQSLRDLEIICVDAGSTDGTIDILNQYAGKDSRIIVLHSDVKSYGKQVNIGLNYASGEYVAVLETDDWIEADMYQCLYETARADALDYAAADFDTFYQLQNGAYYFARQHLFGVEKQEWYGKILNSTQLATLRASDYVLWKAVYNRQFLNTNHIRLHESDGAAFQDMGFLQQIKTYAGRAKYLDRSFYRYRQNRDGSSSVSLEGLHYYMREFLWINDSLNMRGVLNDFHSKYYYLTMSISFITKYEQILVNLDGNWQDERLCTPYNWFKEQVTDAVERNVLDETLYEKEQWNRLMLLLKSQEFHAKLIGNREKKKRKCIQEFIGRVGNRTVVIFGCGVRGERLLQFCDRNDISIHSFCDNNAKLQGEEKYGFTVMSPANLKKFLNQKNGVVLLSMKSGREEVSRQLQTMGIGTDKIIQYIPDGIL